MSPIEEFSKPNLPINTSSWVNNPAFINPSFHSSGDSAKILLTAFILKEATYCSLSAIKFIIVVIISVSANYK